MASKTRCQSKKSNGMRLRRYVHVRALSRLYCGPRRRMTCPRIMKFVAMSGVGPMTVKIILPTCGVSSVCTPATSAPNWETHCMENAMLLRTSYEDQSLPAHPMSSRTPAATAVTSRKYMR